MKPLRIDFAPPSLRRTLFHLHPALLAGALLGLFLCVSAAIAGYQLMRARQAHDAQLLQARQRLAKLSGIAVPLPRTLIAPAQAAAVNGAILQLNLPWRDLQDAVAAATPGTVALLTLEPDARKHVLKLTAEAKNSDDMIAYIEKLKQQDFFSAVLLTRHEINLQDANLPIRFQLEVQWANQ